MNDFFTMGSDPIVSQSIPHGASAFACTSTGTGPMDATPGGCRLATPRGNTLSPLGVRPSHP